MLLEQPYDKDICFRFCPDSRKVEYEICADNYEPDSHDGIVFVSQHDEKGVKFEQKA